MKIKITRSFSKKVQLKQYEPIDAFCAAETEIERDDEVYGEQKAMTEVSELLDQFCRDEVEKTLHAIRPSLVGDEKPKPEWIQKSIKMEEIKADSDEANSIE